MEKILQDFYKKSASKLSMQRIIEKFLHLKSDGGNTRESLENFRKIKEYFEPTRITFHLSADNKDTKLHTEWQTETSDAQDIFIAYDFRGFNAGYGGEGPKGLHEALKSLNISDWDMDKIAGLKPGIYKIL